MTPSIETAGLGREQVAAALIRVFEGLRLEAFQDSGGVWTIGYGHTAGVKEGDRCAPGQAALWLNSDASLLFSLVSSLPLFAAAAWISFGYNCGYHTLELALAGKVDMRRYVHDRHGKVLPGLEARRALEYTLIQSGMPGEVKP